MIAPLAAQKGAAAAAERLAAAGDAHLLLVRGERPMPPRRFLLAVAVGEPGKEDVAFAGRLARHLGSPATVLTVLPPAARRARRAPRPSASSPPACARWRRSASPPSPSSCAASWRRRSSSGWRASTTCWCSARRCPTTRAAFAWGPTTRALLDDPGDVPILIIRSGVREPGEPR